MPFNSFQDEEEERKKKLSGRLNTLDYESVIKDRIATRKNQMRGNMSIVSSINPDQHAKVLDASEKAGLDPMIVKDNVDEIEKANRVNEIDFNNIQEKAPSLADFILERKKAAMIQDEVPYWQEFIEDWGNEVKDFQDDISGAFNATLDNIKTADLGYQKLEGWAGIGDELTAAQEAEFSKEGVGEDYTEGRGLFTSTVISTAEALPFWWETFKSGAEYGLAGAGTGAALGAGTALVAGQLGPQAFLPEEPFTMTVGAIAGAKRLGIPAWRFGTGFRTTQLESGLALKEFSQIRGVDGERLDENVANTAALVVGIANGMLENVGFNKIFNTIPNAKKFTTFADKGKLKKLLATTSFKQVIKAAGKRYAAVAATEGVTEGLQEIVAILGGEAAKLYDAGDFDPIRVDEALDRVTESFVKGAQAGIGLGTIGIGSQAVIDTNRVLKAQKHQKNLAARIDKLMGSGLATRSQDMMTELYQSVADSKGEGETHINVAPLVNKLQEAGLDTGEFFNQLGINEDQVFDAITKGGDVVINTGDMLNVAQNSDFMELLIANIRHTPDAMTALEAEDYIGRVEQDAAAAVEKLNLEAQETIKKENVADKIFDAVAASIIDAGAEAEGGQRYAVAELFRGMALRQLDDWAAEGKEFNAEQFINGFGLKFKREGFPEIAATRNITNPQLSGLINELRTAKGEKFKSLETEAFGQSISERARDLGIRDDRGDLFAQDVDRDLIKDKRRKDLQPDMMREEGVTLDEFGLQMMEEGFFTERPTEAEVLDAIIDDFRATERSQKRFSETGLVQENADRLAGLEGLDEELQRAGLDIDEMTNEQIIEALSGPQEVGDKDTLFQQESQPFFSSVASAVEGLKQEKGSGQQFLAAIKKTAGVKEEEIVWIGLDEFLKGKKSVTKQEIIDYVDQNKVEIEDVVKGGFVDPLDAGYITEENGLFVVYNKENEAVAFHDDLEVAERQLLRYADPSIQTKFGDYVLPGGKNYREVLLTMPKGVVDREIVDVLSGGEGQPYIVEYSDGVTEVLTGSEGMSSRLARAKAQARVDDGLAKAETGFRGQHFEEKNILSHVRLNDRTGPNGEKILFIEEIQSDWHQLGRKEGYRTPDLEKRQEEWESRYRGVKDEYIKLGNQLKDDKLLKELEIDTPWDKRDYRDKIRQRRDVLEKTLNNMKSRGTDPRPVAGVPDAPLKKTWHEMTFRRVAHMAAEGGYDQISWTSGDVQADRYDLSKKISEVQLSNSSGGVGRASTEFNSGTLVAYDLNGDKIIDVFIDDPKEIEDYIGKDAAQKLIEDKGRAGTSAGLGTHTRRISGLDLKVGGEGMKSFYDKMLKNYANKFGKKFGAKVGTIEINQEFSDKEIKEMAAFDDRLAKSDFKGQEVWSLPITDKMRETATTEGFPLFQKGIDKKRGGIRPQEKEHGFGDFNAKFEIFVTPDQNLSTLLHESGHLFLEMLGREAAMEGAPKRVVDNMTAALEWLGVEKFEDITTEHHEKWARGFEVYLREGKSPSARMQRTFDKFRAWLVYTYKRLTGLYDIEITPEVKGIFDTLLASESEVSQVEADNAFKVNTDISELMTDSEIEAYFGVAQRSHDEAVSETLKKRMNIEKREATKWWNAAEKKVKAEITDQVWSENLYQAWHFMHKGEFYDSDMPPELKNVRVNRQKLIDVFGTEGVLQDMPRTVPPMWKKEGGLHPDELAVMVGYASGYELISDIQNAERPTKRIARLTEDKMAVDYPKPDIADEALEATFNDQRALFLASELKALRRKAGEDFGIDVVGKAASSPLGVMKQAVKRVIDQTKVKDITKPFIYLNNSQRAARAVQQAIVDKDYQAATSAKAQQLFNFLMFRAALDIKEKSQKIRKRLGDAARKTINPTKVNPEYITAIKGVSKSVISGNIDTLRASVEWAKAQELDPDNPANLVIPAMFAGDYSEVTIDNMTFTELQSVDSMIKSLREEGRRRSDEVAFEYAERDQSLGDAVYKNVKRKPRTRANKSKMAENTGDYFDKYMNGHVTASTFFEEMDGFEDMGEVWESFKGKVAQMRAAEIEMNEVKLPELRNIFDKYFSRVDIAKRMYQTVHLGDFGELSTIKRQKILSLAMNFGNDGNIQAIEDGYGVSREKLFAAVDKHMSKKDWQFVQAILDYEDSFWPEVAALEKRVTGVVPEKVEATPINSKHGTFRGGYHRLKYDKGISILADKNALNDAAALMGSGRIGRAQTKNGATYERVGSGGQAVRLDLDVIFSNVNETIHDLTFREGIYEVSRLLNGRHFTKAIQDTFGADVHTNLRKWLKDVAVGNTEPIGVIDKFLKHVRTGTTVVTLGFALATMAVQLLGLASTLTRLGTAQTIKGLAKFYANPKAGWKFVFENSPFMRNRFSNFDRDAQAFSRSITNPSISQNVALAAFKGIGFMDLMVSMPTWISAYSQGMEKFNNDAKKAARHADNIVIGTQGSGEIQDLTAIMRGPEGTKLLTMFMSYFVAMHQLLRRNKTQLKDGGISPAQFALNMLYLIILPPVVDGLMRGDEPEDDEGYAEWAGKKIGAYSFTSLVGVRSFTSYMLEDFGFQLTPVEAVLKKGMQGAGSVLTEEDVTDYQVKNAVTLFGVATRTPTKKIYSQADYLLKVLENEQDFDAQEFIFNKRKD